jgi:hypothetical protein
MESAKMADELKKFEATYKKCRASNKGCTLETATRLVKKIKNCQSSASTGFFQLSDEVATAQSKGVVGKKIEDYAKEKNVLSVLKGIKSYQAEQFSAWTDLEDLEQRVLKCGPCLTKLSGDITKDLKKRNKSSKSKPAIEKLQKQIDADLKEFKAISAKVKLIPPLYRDPAKIYINEIKKIVSAKPADLAKTKYNTMAPRKMDTRILKKYVNQCTKSFKAVKEDAGLAVNAAKEGNKKAMAANLKACKVELQKILDIEKEYSTIKKNFQTDINNSKDKKQIEGSIAHFVKIKVAAEKLVRNAVADIKKAA